MKTSEFEGFSAEAFTFLRALKRNNRREWFQPRKEKYEALLLTPMRALVRDLGGLCGKSMPSVRFDPKKAVFRIYRDVRFSEDKAPYKTHIAASFSAPRTKRFEDNPGFYLHVEPKSVFLAAGLYMPSSQQLRRLRAAIVAEPKTFLKLVESKRFKADFAGIQGETLKTSPRGIAADHPMVRYLRHKQFYVHCELSEDAARRPDFPGVVAGRLKAMAPFVHWLESALARDGDE